MQPHKTETDNCVAMPLQHYFIIYTVEHTRLMKSIGSKASFGERKADKTNKTNSDEQKQGVKIFLQELCREIYQSPWILFFAFTKIYERQTTFETRTNVAKKKRECDEAVN